MYVSYSGFRDRAISLYSCKIVDKEMLGIVFNIGVYCSSDKVGTVYSVQYIFENPTVNISALCCVARLSASWRTFMLAITTITRSSNSPLVSTCVLSILLFIKPHKQKSNGAQYGGCEGPYWVPNPNSCTVK
jgi:hypothetical protein